MRHEFQPGRLVAGLFLIGVALAYAGDAAGWWDTLWFAALPTVIGGLCLAAVVGMVTGAIRHRIRRARRRANNAENAENANNAEDTAEGW
ncbi:hypothetical protein [Streptomyces sp. NPDC050560]|uniref:hypothetical protein n=1 Tax=Streptomyces sp. NPDC050560 TaxID=3365630 RepID=UPI00378AE51A